MSASVFFKGSPGNPLQCSCLESPRDGGAWWAAIYGVAQSQTRLKRLTSSRFLKCGRIEKLRFTTDVGKTLVSTQITWGSCLKKKKKKILIQ